MSGLYKTSFLFGPLLRKILRDIESNCGNEDGIGKKEAGKDGEKGRKKKGGKRRKEERLEGRKRRIYDEEA